MSEAPVQAGPFRVAEIDLSTATRAVQMAKALIDRFSELSRSREGDLDSMELVIGEAGQIYPEIWSNLDLAYAALKKRGIELPAFEALRNVRLSAGVLATETIAYGRAQRKTARYDDAGNARALQACAALRTAMPTVDWGALDAKDAEAAALGASLGPSTSAKIFMKLAMGTAIALIAAAYIIWKFRLL